MRMASHFSQKRHKYSLIISLILLFFYVLLFYFIIFLLLVYFVTDFISASVFEFVGTGHTCAVHVQLLYSGEH